MNHYNVLIDFSVERDPVKVKSSVKVAKWSRATIGAIVFFCLIVFCILIAIFLMTTKRGKYDVEKRRQQTVNADSNDLNATP